MKKAIVETVTNLTIKVSKLFQMLIILKSSFFVWCTCYSISVSVKISHVMIGTLTNLIFINIHHQFPQR